MHIGLDATCTANRRGFGRFARELFHALATLDTGDEYTLFCDRPYADSDQLPKDWRVVIAETRVAATEAASADGRRSIGDMLAMRKAVSRERIDLMYFPAVYTYFPVAGKFPCLVTFHDVIAETLPHLIFHNKRSQFFWNLKSRLAIRRASKIVTVSQASKEGLMRHFKLGEDRMRVISEAPGAAFSPVDVASGAHQQAIKRYDLSDQDRYFIYVGGISPHKNLHSLVEGFSLVGELGKDVQLLLVGDYQGDVFRTCYEELMVVVRKYNLASRVRFLGYVPDDDLAHLYAGSMALVFPSYLEGFGLPAVEAMKCGTAVIASDRGSLPEVLGGAGLLFDPDSPQSLADALTTFLSSESYRNQITTQCVRRGQDFSWETAARQLVEVFHEFKPFI